MATTGIDCSVTNSETTLQRLLDQLGSFVYCKDIDGRYTYVNQLVCTLLRKSREQILGATDAELFPADIAAVVRQHDLCVCTAGQVMSFEEILPGDGDRLAYFWTIKQPLFDEQGRPAGIAGIASDMTERKQQEQEIVALKNRLAAILAAMPDLMFELDGDGRYLEYHSPCEHLLAAPPSSLLGKTVREMLPQEAAAICHDALRDTEENGFSGGQQYSLQLPDGEHWFELSIARKHNGPEQKNTYIALARDITERKQADDKIRHLAFYDPLTGLPNRRLMFDRLGQALAGCARRQRQGALLLIDLDSFKVLNDTEGHEAGDRLLVEVATRLTNSIRHGDTAARLGGDEFVVILEDIDGLQSGACQAEILALKLLHQLSLPYDLGVTPEGRRRTFQCTSSIGIIIFGDEPTTAEKLLRCADSAMYQAKAAGRNALRFFDPEMQATVTQRAALEADMRIASKQQQFQPYFQPQVDVRQRIVGAELLLRWPHPRSGMISPGEFIPLAEESGLIVPLGTWVLEQACELLSRWAGHEATDHLTLAVNVSARQFRLSTFAGELKSLLEKTGARPQRLKLELTESLLLESSHDIIGRMFELRELGIRFSLDDFGTGYSSLAYLKKLPLDQLKIDQSFVRDVLSDPNDAAIARTIVALGNTLGLAVIAEGVETTEQHEFLLNNGCNTFQGYLFGRPQPLSSFEALLGIH